MAMLAEPRRRRAPQVNVRATTAWSADTSKFGQKLLERMGWEQGGGLGANLQGAPDALPLKRKIDASGLGFKDTDDAWTQHGADFAGLLRSLNNAEEDDESQVKASLEEKSKNLQSRLHYKKFTKGKDISQYSSKDLANIFGKKSLKKAPKTDSVDCDQTDKVVTSTGSAYDFVSAGSIKDYFESKMAGVKFKSNVKTASDMSEDCGVMFRGFSGTGYGSSNDEVVSNECADDAEKLVQDNTIKAKKKKKNKVKNFENETVVENVDESTANCDVNKKKKRCVEENEVTHEASESIESCNGKRKKRRTEENEIVEENSRIKKKKRVKENKCNELVECETNDTTEHSLPAKKNKKHKKQKL
ncbi:PIN2/TERF1-interacting telomerase inhibitor 1-like isoform X2 [Arctopsyche grandis]|uniref:PIN2/TERF1-interacting telomerase inhibitor 1-like isoform X2 n=1 Tax=Arctopsyche grandis TaxID=121162 RepID=UPI00406D914D